MSYSRKQVWLTRILLVVLIYLSICLIIPAIEYYYYYTAFDAGSVFRDLSSNLGANFFIGPAFFLPQLLFKIDIFDNIYREFLPSLLLLLSSLGSASLILLILVVLLKIDRFFLKNRKRYNLFLIPLLFFVGTYFLHLGREASSYSNSDKQHSLYHEKYEFDTPIISDAKFIYPEVTLSNGIENTDIVISDINSKNKEVIKSFFNGMEIGYISPNGKYGFVLTKNPYGGTLLKTIINIVTSETFDFCNTQEGVCGDNIVWSPQGNSFLYDHYVYGQVGQEKKGTIKQELTLFELNNKTEKNIFESYNYLEKIHYRNSFAWIDEKSFIISNYTSNGGEVYYGNISDRGEILIKTLDNLKACLSVVYLNQYVYCLLPVKDLYPDLNFPDKSNDYIIGGDGNGWNHNIDYTNVAFIIKQNLQQANKNDLQLVTKSPISIFETRRINPIDSNFLFISFDKFTNTSEYIIDLKSGRMRHRKGRWDPEEEKYFPGVPNDEIPVFYSGSTSLRVLSTRPALYNIGSNL